ncbi:MAG TPA: cytochrome c [Bryobacteraceae bacterium]|nr:cytochrome c [Bryobacteraceae bacterium]
MRRALLVLMLAPVAWAHDTITTKLLWTQEVSRIVYRHCARCHRDGGSAMSLLTYDEARPWAKAIRDEVLARRMPPWGAVKGVGEFRGDPSLSQIEIDMLVNWVEGGAPKGDDVFLPPAPHFSADAAEPVAARELSVTTARPLTITSPAVLSGLRPAQLAPGESLEVTAYLSDGAVRRLIWIRNWLPQWQRTYYFLHPVQLPKGTRIAAYSGKPAGAILALSR